MQQIVFHIPIIGWPLPSFGLMLVLALVAVIAWGKWRAPKVGMAWNNFQDMAMLLLFTGLAGARMLYMIQYAEQFPFTYTPENTRELSAYLDKEPAGKLLQAWIDDARKSILDKPIITIDFIIALNTRLQHDIKYLIRMEPGVQTPEKTLDSRMGSCRDSAWLLVQILRHFGIAARFASGYLIQLVADVKGLDGPSGTEKDFTDLHAWAEAYLPGAGWVGLDPTSGLLAGEGHIPLACAAIPTSAAPVSGSTDVCESTLKFEMTVTRIHEDPRVTKPYNDAQWSAINALGEAVDGELEEGDVFVLPRGWSGRWDITETVRKLYVSADPPLPS